MQLPRTTARLALVAAGVLGAAGAIGVAEAATDGGDDPTTVQAASSGSPRSSDDGPGDISGPCDEAEHADDPRCAGVTVPGGGTPPSAPTTAPGGTAGTTPTAPMPPGGSTVPTPGGTVAYTFDGTTLHLAGAIPASGWAVEIEQSSGRELEVDFRSGSQRVQVNVEVEDGRPRERVRLRDDADDTDVRIEDGVVDRDHLDDDSSGSGRGHSGDDSGHHDGRDDSGHHGGDDDSGSGSRHSGGHDDD
ncbi:MAG TPA: hypothetical protein VIL36_14865 [Acidimicrobiales bacterium]